MSSKQARKDLIFEFLRASELGVMDLLLESVRGNLDSIVNTPEYLFVPGVVSQGPLLVVHADTVWDKVRPQWSGDLVCSSNSIHGIGADDRLGCALLCQLLLEGYTGSFLVTTGEEEFGIGAKAAVREIGPLLAQHSFMLELDRGGDEQVAWYPGSRSPELEACLKHIIPEYTVVQGSFTDVAVLSPMVGVAGMNITCGYLYEHTSDEIGILPLWEKNLTSVVKILEASLGPFPVKVQQPQLVPVFKASKYLGIVDCEQYPQALKYLKSDGSLDAEDLVKHGLMKL